MDNNRNLQSVRSQLNAAGTSEHSPMSSRDRREMNSLERIYFSAVVRIIAKTISAANMPSLTEAETADRADDWMEVLYGHVPESRLDQAYRQAVHAHSGPFPVNCYEIIAAYNAIIAGEQAADADARRSYSPSKAEEQAVAAMCDHCHGSGMRLKRDLDGRVLGVIGGKPCDHKPLPDVPMPFAGKDEQIGW